MSFAQYWFIVLTQFWVTFIYDENIYNIVKPLLVYWFTKNFLVGEGEFYMKEIVIQHNGISYTEEDIIHLLDLVMEIVGEEV